MKKLLATVFTVVFLSMAGFPAGPATQEIKSAATWEIRAWNRIVVRPAYKEEIKIRLHGVEANAVDRQSLKRARQVTRRLVAGKVVDVLVLGECERGQVLARVTLPDGRDLGMVLVQSGVAHQAVSG